jgi:protein-L-isoaspartate(D-aspartate) O-methyltransferase
MDHGTGSTPAAEARRADLVDRLVAAGTVRTASVEHALRTVPRERFVPDVDLAEVYEDRPQLVKADGAETLSTISQPTMVAIMLELAHLSPGERVLEIGSGTGYNAALLGTLVGTGGSVVGIDIEEDLVRRARTTLDALGLTQVEVHASDGRLGWPTGAPYDCVMATVGVDEVPVAWREQVADGGRLLVPVNGSRQLVVERRRDDHFQVEATSPAAFIPLR